MCLWGINIRWDDIKGSYLIAADDLQTTPGIILSSQTEESSPRSTGLLYKIKYQYTIAGKRYYSEQVTFTFVGNSDHNFARGYVRKYPVGRAVIVYYDPADPSFAVLEPHEKGSYLGMLSAVCLFAVLFPLSSYWAWKHRKS